MRPFGVRLTLAILLVAVLISLGGAGVPWTTAPASAAQPAGPPTLRQLQQALLTEDDLWESDIPGDWVELDADELDDDYPAVYADFSDYDTDDYLSVELHDARNGVPDFLALALLSLAEVELDELERIDPTGYGTNGVRYRYNYTDEGERWYGEVAAWRYGGVAVAILFESLDPDACVCEYAALQDQKLRATIR